MLLTIHIALGIASVASALGLFANASGRATLVANLQRIVIGSTSLTVLSGGVLIFNGSSIARICGEAALLTAFSVGAVVVSRKKQEGIHAST